MSSFIENLEETTWLFKIYEPEVKTKPAAAIKCSCKHANTMPYIINFIIQNQQNINIPSKNQNIRTTFYNLQLYKFTNFDYNVKLSICTFHAINLEQINLDQNQKNPKIWQKNETKVVTTLGDGKESSQNTDPENPWPALKHFQAGHNQIHLRWLF